ncbi:ROK family protein [Streptomyces sp. NPDC050287]|uniref:ROK family protein n=1 Tax=Streptomyces sp. NPDC050287 TaxID=3365608 RepID=UPI0037A7DE06
MCPACPVCCCQAARIGVGQSTTRHLPGHRAERPQAGGEFERPRGVPVDGEDGERPVFHGVAASRARRRLCALHPFVNKPEKVCARQFQRRTPRGYDQAPQPHRVQDGVVEPDVPGHSPDQPFRSDAASHRLAPAVGRDSAHAAGDPAAQQVIATTGRYLGIAIANLINLCNPQIIVLTGWVADSLGNAMLPHVRATAARYALAEPWEGTEISLCPIDRNPVSLGAATLVLEGFLS